MADLTPAQAAARMKMQAKLKATQTGGEPSWWQRFKTEASDAGTGLLEATKDPYTTLQTLKGVADIGAGGLEAAVRGASPQEGEWMDHLNNYLAEYSGGYLASPKEVGKNSPEADAATEVAKGMYNSFAHPVTSIQEHPFNTTMDWLGAITAGVGKVPGIVTKAGELKSAQEIIAASKAAKDAAFEAAYKHPGPIDTGAIRDSVLRKVDEMGYNPNRARYAPNTPGVDEVRGYPNEGTVRDVHDMRIAADKTDLSPRTGVPGMSPDNSLSQAMKEAIDSGLEQSNPEAFALLKKAFDLNTTYKNTQKILDMRREAELAGKVSANEAKATGQVIRRSLKNEPTTRGLGEENVSQLENVMDIIKGDSGANMYDHALDATSTATGTVGSVIGGLPGAFIGYHGGGVIAKLLKGMKTAKAAKQMGDDLLSIASEINGIPRGPGSRELGLITLTPAQRKGLLGILGASNAAAGKR